ncbi:MAG: YraN family protein [Treponema sp.]|jgi:putative endonuclease|nr:YraN family protein [Treponema sp.]
MTYTKTTGFAGEAKAAAFLETQGYTIVCRNWRTPQGEIDIIAEKDGALVFAEVKTLPNGGPETLARVLDEKKQRRIVKTAKNFLNMYRQYSSGYIRFDVLIVDTPGFDPVHHIENAFVEQT